MGEVRKAIYEADFLGYSYGFRPGRGQHDTLDALYMAITQTKVNWMVDADIAQFFDSMRCDWRLRFLKQRIGDPRVLHLLRKWLKAERSNAVASGIAPPGSQSIGWRAPSFPHHAPFIPGLRFALPSHTQGGSRVPESGPLGSVRGALSNGCSYRDF